MTSTSTGTRRSPREATPTGIVRNIDELGRIVIPIEIRKRLGLGEKDPLEISVQDDTILLARPRLRCVFCASEASLREHRGRSVCAHCVAALAGGETRSTKPS